MLNIAFLFTINKIIAYKNKYNTSGPKLSLTVSLVQYKSRKPTNTSIAFIDLDLHIYVKKTSIHQEIIFITEIKS
jgi:hypothetical protein